MSKATYPLKLPASIKAAAARLAREDGVSLNQWIAAAVAQKVGAVQTAAGFFQRRGEGAKPGDLRAILARVPDRAPDPGDELPEGWRMVTDWKEEALEAMAAKWAEEEAAWRRDNVGKIRLSLVKATDEPPPFSAEGQVDLRNVIAALKKNKIEVDAPFMTLDSVDAVGGYTGEIAVLATAFGPVLAGILAAWLQSKAGRKVRLKDGDIEVEARTVEEAERLLDVAAEQRAKREREGGSTIPIASKIRNPPF